MTYCVHHSGQEQFNPLSSDFVGSGRVLLTDALNKDAQVIEQSPASVRHIASCREAVVAKQRVDKVAIQVQDLPFGKKGLVGGSVALVVAHKQQS